MTLTISIYVNSANISMISPFVTLRAAMGRPSIGALISDLMAALVPGGIPSAANKVDGSK